MRDYLPFFGIHDTVAHVSCPDKFGILCLELGEVLLGFPIPDAVTGEDQVHLLERSLVTFGI